MHNEYEVEYSIKGSKVLMFIWLQLLLQMLRVVCQHSIEALEIYRVGALSVRGLHNDIINHKVVLDVRRLILLHFRM